MLITDIDPDEISETGWGVIFSPDEDPAVRAALQRLLAHRRQQCGALYKELVYNETESVRDFRIRHGIGSGPIDPKKMPFYLLLVGDPATVPFDFQSQLSLNHAVGRLHFDRLDDYAEYAESVLLFESSQISKSRRATFVSVQNQDDTPTALVSHRLIHPLASHLRAQLPGWKIDIYTDQQATKAEILSLLASAEVPEFLLVSAHGYSFNSGHENQRDYQGSLVCQDWPGPRSKCPIAESHVLSADDLDSSLRLTGTIFFLLSSYSVGTSQFDDFPHDPSTGLATLAPRPFVNRLAQSLSNRGALAIIGHVDRPWTTSYIWPGDGQMVSDVTFQDVLYRLLQGQRVGWAMRPMVQRYMELSTELSELLYGLTAGREMPAGLDAHLWTGLRNARNFVVLGDPAVRLSTDK